MEKEELLAKILLFYFVYPSYYCSKVEKLIKEKPKAFLTEEEEMMIAEYLQLKSGYDSFTIKNKMFASESASQGGSEFVIDVKAVFKSNGIPYDPEKDFFTITQTKKSGLAGLFGGKEYTDECSPMLAKCGKILAKAVGKPDAYVYIGYREILKKDPYNHYSMDDLYNDYNIKPARPYLCSMLDSKKGPLPDSEVYRRVALFSITFTDGKARDKAILNAAQYLQDNYGIERNDDYCSVTRKYY